MEEAALALAIDGLLDRSTAELSGGELQRTALGAALAGSPAVVVLDEPTSQLDPVAGDELIGLLRRANEDSDATIILAEHRLERCLSAADRVLVVDGARDRVRRASGRLPGVGGSRGAEPPDARRPAAVRLGLEPVAGVKRARSALRRRDLLPPGPPSSATRARGRAAHGGRLRHAGTRGRAPAMAL